jgi:hypothetical protein
MRRFVPTLLAALLGAFVLAPPAQADFSEFEVESASASLSTNQAGAHADLTTEFALKTQLGEGDVVQTRDVSVALPPGLLGDPTKFPKCTLAELTEIGCPQSSQVGITEALLLGNTKPIVIPIYNMAAPQGGNIVARLGFIVLPFYPVTINVRVHPEEDYAVSASLGGIASLVPLRTAKTTIWGVPTSPSHDSERITPQEGANGEAPPGGGRASELPPTPFLSNPTRCGVPLEVSVSADTYQRPGVFSTRTADLGPLGGCGKLSFAPALSATPTSTEAAAPTGLDVDLQVPQDESPEGLATSHLRDARVTLSEGMTLSPGAADGLGSCDASQAAYKADGPAHCPEAAKIGSAELDVVGLEHPLRGALYQRTPEGEELFRIWIVANEEGVHVALPGEIALDQRTGQITSSFAENPQVPLREAKLHIFGGPRAPLANPSRCGAYQTAWELTPWSGGAAVEGNAPMSIDTGCQAGGFSPGLELGTTSPLVGAVAPLVTEITRRAGEGNISGLTLALPPGLLAKLRGVPLCEAASALEGSCPAGSRIGSVAVAAGPGADPLWIPQPGKEATAVYLTGPYKGAPYGLAVRVPAQAGPFDLGTVVTMVALEVDPTTARVIARSDPLPQILKGVPVSYRDLRVYLDRPDFTINPTSCKELSATAAFTSPEGQSATATSPFRLTGCRELPYSPHLKLRFTATGRSADPGVTATLTQRQHQAATAAATVILPSTEYIDNSHINNPCTRVQFAAEACPPKSILGHAEAQTPLLDQPLKGPVYFRSDPKRELPDIVADLHGQIHIVLVGFIDARVKPGTEISRVRTRFLSVPDAPVSKFTMHLYGGRRGLIENSRDLCEGKSHKAKVRLVGQNGRVRSSGVRLGIRCPN